MWFRTRWNIEKYEFYKVILIQVYDWNRKAKQYIVFRHTGFEVLVAMEMSGRNLEIEKLRERDKLHWEAIHKELQMS